MYINLTVLCWEVDGLYPTIEMVGISPSFLLKNPNFIRLKHIKYLMPYSPTEHNFYPSCEDIHEAAPCPYVIVLV